MNSKLTSYGKRLPFVLQNILRKRLLLTHLKMKQASQKRTKLGASHLLAQSKIDLQGFKSAIVTGENARPRRSPRQKKVFRYDQIVESLQRPVVDQSATQHLSMQRSGSLIYDLQNQQTQRVQASQRTREEQRRLRIQQSRRKAERQRQQLRQALYSVEQLKYSQHLSRSQVEGEKVGSKTNNLAKQLTDRAKGGRLDSEIQFSESKRFSLKNDEEYPSLQLKTNSDINISFTNKNLAAPDKASVEGLSREAKSRTVKNSRVQGSPNNRAEYRQLLQDNKRLQQQLRLSEVQKDELRARITDLEHKLARPQLQGLAEWGSQGECERCVDSQKLAANYRLLNENLARMSRDEARDSSRLESELQQAYQKMKELSASTAQTVQGLRLKLFLMTEEAAQRQAQLGNLQTLLRQNSEKYAAFMQQMKEQSTEKGDLLEVASLKAQNQYLKCCIQTYENEFAIRELRTGDRGDRLKQAAEYAQSQHCLLRLAESKLSPELSARVRRQLLGQ